MRQRLRAYTGFLDHTWPNKCRRTQDMAARWTRTQVDISSCRPAVRHVATMQERLLVITKWVQRQTNENERLVLSVTVSLFLRFRSKLNKVSYRKQIACQHSWSTVPRICACSRSKNWGIWSPPPWNGGVSMQCITER